VLEQAGRVEQKLRYDGAKSGRRTDGWVSGSSDANVETMGALVWLRDRSRDLVRNNPYAVKAIEELVGNTVGTGITPQANTGIEELDRIIDQEWPYFAENCDPSGQMDIYGKQALTVRTMAESGESVCRFRPRLSKDNLRVPLQLQLLESDFLDHTRSMATTNGYVVQGVQFDLIEHRTAYWLYNQHPGGVTVNPRGGILSQPVSADQVMHTYRMLRPGQVRGVPWLAPVMMALRDLDDYSDTERVRKKIEACLAIVLETPSDDSSPLGNTSTDPVSGQLLEEIHPGMIARTKPGEKVSFLSPTAMGGYREYKTTELQAISSGTGVPYEQIASDMSNTTYSSWRGGQLGFRNTIENYRWLSLMPMFCNPVWRRFVDTLVVIGKIPAKLQSDAKVNLYGVQWTAPKWESVDPLKDAKAELQRIRTGTETLFAAIAANGGDPRTQLQQIANVNKLLDSLGVVLDCDPRYTNIRGQEQPGDTNPKQPGRQGPPGAAKASAFEESDEDDDQMTLTMPRRRWDSAVRGYRN